MEGLRRVFSLPTLGAACRDFYLVVLDDLAEWPTELPFGTRRFSVFLVLDDRDVGADGYGAWNVFVERAIAQGLAYFSAWGPNSSRLDDLMDDTLVVRDVVEGRGEAFLMTTWHDQESLEEALDFFKYDAIDPSLQDPCAAPGIITLVGRQELEPEVERAITAVTR